MSGHLAIQLRTARGDRTQAKCAEACGVSQNHYAKVERGETLPSLALVQRMADLTGATFCIAPKGDSK